MILPIVVDDTVIAVSYRLYLGGAFGGEAYVQWLLNHESA